MTLLSRCSRARPVDPAPPAPSLCLSEPQSPFAAHGRRGVFLGSGKPAESSDNARAGKAAA